MKLPLTKAPPHHTLASELFIHSIGRGYAHGLTKGQYSPTSEVGKKTKSSPYGSLDAPVDPVKLALGAGCSWVARSVDRFTKHLRAKDAATPPE